MKIKFDANIPLAGIGLVPWSRLGPERWFSNYTIASLHGWDVTRADAPNVISLTDIAPASSEQIVRTQQLLKNPHFQRLLTNNLSAAHFLTYKPVQIPAELSGLHFLQANKKLAVQLENKRMFRELMKDEALPFPRYSVYERLSLRADRAADILDGRQEVILQDEAISGGKGTFVVRDAETLNQALGTLKLIGGSRFAVVSDLIEQPHERTVQAVVTRHGVFVGPFQKQHVADPLLSNLEVPTADRLCGVEIPKDDRFAGAYDEISDYARRIGKRIQSMGYKGIFGLDCLVTEGGQVYVLEINPRITGATPLLTMLYRDGEDIPFYLLHILELLDAEYTIADDAVNPVPREGSLLFLHSHNSQPATLEDAPRSGLYDTMPFKFVSGELQLGDAQPNQVLVQQYIPQGITVKPGVKLLTMFSARTVHTDSEELSEEATKLVKTLYEMVTLN